MFRFFLNELYLKKTQTMTFIFERCKIGQIMKKDDLDLFQEYIQKNDTSKEKLQQYLYKCIPYSSKNIMRFLRDDLNIQWHKKELTSFSSFDEFLEYLENEVHKYSIFQNRMIYDISGFKEMMELVYEYGYENHFYVFYEAIQMNQSSVLLEYLLEKKFETNLIFEELIYTNVYIEAVQNESFELIPLFRSMKIPDLSPPGSIIWAFVCSITTNYGFDEDLDTEQKKVEKYNQIADIITYLTYHDFTLPHIYDFQFQIFPFDDHIIEFQYILMLIDAGSKFYPNLLENYVEKYQLEEIDIHFSLNQIKKIIHYQIPVSPVMLDIISKHASRKSLHYLERHFVI